MYKTDVSQKKLESCKQNTTENNENKSYYDCTIDTYSNTKIYRVDRFKFF